MSTCQTGKGRDRRKKDNALAKYVIFSLAIVIIYTVVEFTFSTITGVSHDALTTCVYGFWGGEIVMSAVIKIFKIKSKETEE